MLEYNLVGLMYTRTCPLSCGHCMTNSSPDVKERMRYDEAIECIRAVPEFASSLSFTGGEPFLYYRDIAKMIAEAKSLGLRVSLVTGAGWVRNEAQARAKIKTVAAAGLDRLCISWDRYHEEFSPPDRAVLVARLATQFGIAVNVRSVSSAEHGKTDYSALFQGIPVKLEQQTVIKLGRAASLPSSHFDFIDSPPGGTCSAVLAPTIEPDGNVYACCGPSHFCHRPSPLLLGNIRQEPLRDILQRGREDPLLEVIYNSGPFGLYQLLKGHPAGCEAFKRRAAYTSSCELCLDITDDPVMVSAIRDRLSDADGQRMLAVSRLWRQNSPNA